MGCGRLCLERYRRRATPAVACRRGSGFGSVTQSRFGEISSVRVPGGLAAHDTHTGAPRPAGHELLHSTIIEPGARAAAVLGEDLREVATVAESVAQRAFEDVAFDHGVARVGE